MTNSDDGRRRRTRATIEQALADACISLEKVNHGDDIACWAVNGPAIPGGTAYEPDKKTRPCSPMVGRTAEGTATLHAAASMLGWPDGSKRPEAVRVGDPLRDALKGRLGLIDEPGVLR